MADGTRSDAGNEYLGDLPALDADYLGYDHHTLKQMVETGNDPGQVDGMAAAWNEIGGAFARFGDEIVGAARASEADWQGEAGDRARDLAVDMGGWFGGAAARAEHAGANIARQAEAASLARSSMPEPVDFSIGDAMTMLMTETNPLHLPAVMGEIRQNFEAKQQAHAEAAEVVQTYDSTLYETGSAMPAFTVAPAPNQVTAPEPRSPESPVAGE